MLNLRRKYKKKIYSFCSKMNLLSRRYTTLIAKRETLNNEIKILTTDKSHVKSL